MSKDLLKKNLTTIPISDQEAFEDYDNDRGYCNCLYINEGKQNMIVVLKDQEKAYRKFVEEFEEWMDA